MSEMPRTVIASRLKDGLTVFLAPGNRWVESINHSAVARDETDAAELMKSAERAAKRNLVVNPYLIEIIEQGEQRTPREWRETIRAFGPTIENPTTA